LSVAPGPRKKLLENILWVGRFKLPSLLYDSKKITGKTEKVLFVIRSTIGKRVFLQLCVGNEKRKFTSDAVRKEENVPWKNEGHKAIKRKS